MTSSVAAGQTRDRLYQACASQHAGQGGGRATALAYRRDLRPLLPSPANGPIMDIGCGQGELLRLLLADGYDAEGVDVSPEQVAIAHTAGLDCVHEGDYRVFLDGHPGTLAAVTATDVLEHMAKEEVLETFDHIAAALAPGGDSWPGYQTL